MIIWDTSDFRNGCSEVRTSTWKTDTEENQDADKVSRPVFIRYLREVKPTEDQINLVGVGVLSKED